MTVATSSAPTAAPRACLDAAARRAALPFVALLAFAFSLAIRLDGIDLYSTTDEGFWMQRSVRFGAALLRGDLASTFRVGHPGVTVMWAGFLGMGTERVSQYLPEPYTRHDLLERAPGYLDAHTAARRAVAVVTSLLVAVAIVLAWHLFGSGPALAGGLILMLDPYVIGITRLLHVEAVLAPLMTVSALAGLLAWTAPSRWGYLALSAVTGGLALLTKAPAGFVPIFLGLVCLAGIWRGGLPSAPRRLLPLALWGTIAAAVCFLTFPALWVDPIGRIGVIVGYVARVGLQPHDGNFFLGQPTYDDPGPLYYVVAIPLRLSPVVALGVALLALRAAPGERRAAARWLVVYVALFAALMTLASKKFDRYMLPAVMMLDLLAGVGLWRLVHQLATEPPTWSRGTRGDVGSRAAPPLLARQRRRGRALGLAALGLVAAVQLVLLARVWPYPIAYYNPLAGGPEKARELIMVGWGEGLEQAAAYLNSLPNAERLYVVTSYHHVVRPRFVGVTLPIRPYFVPQPNLLLPVPDYVVLYVNGVQRRQAPPLGGRTDIYGAPVFVAEVNGQPYAWVYQVPRSGPRPTVPLPADDADEREN